MWIILYGTKYVPVLMMMEDKGIEPVPISVNVSRMHVYQEKFTENLKNMAGGIWYRS